MLLGADCNSLLSFQYLTGTFHLLFFFNLHSMFSSLGNCKPRQEAPWAWFGTELFLGKEGS